MRVLNKHKGNVVSIEPGAVGEVDENNDGIKVFLSAGLLVDVSTIEPTPEREPTLEEAKKVIEALTIQIDEIVANCSRLHKELDAARADCEEIKARAVKREGEMQLAIDDLASQLATARERASKAEAERDGVRTRIAELEAQLALKSEPAPADAPAPDAVPAKKGRG